MMTTDMKDFIVENIGLELREVFRATMEDQIEHDLYYKSFSNQLESDDEVETLQQRMKWWMVVVDKLGVISNDVYGYTFAELCTLYR